MISNGLKVSVAACLCLGGLLAGCLPEEDSGECNASKACGQRGEVCNELTHQCEVAGLDVDGTAETTPASFSDVPVPFFRGKVCMPTKIQPGNTVPVTVSTCLHPCIAENGYSFKKQYRCNGSSCESLVLVYYPKADGAGCPADAFGTFAKSQCVYKDHQVSAGPFNLSTGPVTGTATIEVPFLSNDDIATLLPLEDQGDARVAKTWELAYMYPPDADRVFQLSINGSNPPAPADCAGAGCDCREIGF